MQERLVLMVIIDALDHCLSGDHAFLPEYASARPPVRSMLGFSSANIPTIMTGLPPDRHGHFMMYRKAGRDGVFRRIAPVVSALSRLTGRHWQLRRWTARQIRMSGITGYFSLYEVPLRWIGRFDLCQRRSLFRPGGFCGIESLVDILTEDGKGRAWGWDVPEEQAFREVEEEIGRGVMRALMVYTPFLDGLLHAVGPFDPQARGALDRYQEVLRLWMKIAAGRYGEVRLFVFGDHGMAPVHSHHDIWSGLRSLSARAPGEYLYFLDSTMARFWFFSDRARNEVMSFLGEQEYGRILHEQELADLGCAFREQEYGEVIFLLHEGRILVPSFMGSQPVRGMHGYHPDDAHSHTALVTNTEDLSCPKDLRELHGLLRSEIVRAVR